MMTNFVELPRLATAPLSPGTTSAGMVAVDSTPSPRAEAEVLLIWREPISGSHDGRTRGSPYRCCGFLDLLLPKLHAPNEACWRHSQ